MKPEPMRLVPILAVFASLLGGCLDPAPLEESSIAPSTLVTVEEEARLAAVQTMRQNAEAAGERDYPDVFAAPGPNAPDPLPMGEVEAIQSELVATANRRDAAVSQAELSAGQARALQLRRLGQTHAETAERAIRSSGAAN